MTNKEKTATIIHIPHPALREVATAVTAIDHKFVKLTKLLKQTLLKTRNPKGVGLAAPQIAVNKRVFATQLENNIQLYINPQITAHSQSLLTGPKGEEPRLEGCLSIPKIYGPVPRWEWVEIEYDELQKEKLWRKKTNLQGFAARVVQHELDHLDGKLFIDYSLTYSLPIYSENQQTKKFETLDQDMLLALGARSL